MPLRRPGFQAGKFAAKSSFISTNSQFYSVQKMGIGEDSDEKPLHFGEPLLYKIKFPFIRPHLGRLGDGGLVVG